MAVTTVTPPIKYIKLSDGNHEIDAKYWDGHTWSDISQFRFVLAKDIDNRIVSKATLEQYLPPNATNYDEYKTSILLVDHAGPPNGLFDEYAIIRSGAVGSYTYTWESIGTTGVDLQGAGKAGTYTTTQVAGYTATVSGSITYNAASNTTKNTQPTFTGTAATITSSGKYTPAGTISNIPIAAHSHAVNLATASLVYVDGVSGTFNTGAIKSADLVADTATTPTWTVVTGITKASSAGSHSHSVNTATSSFNLPTNAIKKADLGTTTGTGIKLVNGVNTSTGAESAHTHPITPSTTSIYQITGVGSLPTRESLTVVTGVPTVTGAPTGTSPALLTATVSTDGILSWSTASYATGAHTHSIAASSTASIYQITGVGVLPSRESLTVVTGVSQTGAGGSHSHSVTAQSATYTITGTNADTTSVTYVTGATLAASGAHTHGIDFTSSGIKISTQAAGTASVSKTTASIIYVTGATTDALPAHTLDAPTFYGTQGNVSVTASYTPEGTVASHSHGITITATSATFSLGAPVAAHTHQVTVDELYAQ